MFDALEQLLPLVSKPIQYVGGEVNAVTKEWVEDVAQPQVRWALMYPDAYEVGAPNQGVQILYEVINERDDALAERTYAVWPDLEALMRERGVPQFTVDAHRAVGDFDPVSYTHLRAHETRGNLVCRLLLEKNFFNDTATTEIYTRKIVGSVRCV